MYQRILVAIDGSTAAQKGLDEAAAMARTVSATLRILHVVEVTHHASGYEPCEVFSRSRKARGGMRLHMSLARLRPWKALAP